MSNLTDNWFNITNAEDVMAIIEKSEHKPQLIFKHSVTCGISNFAQEKLITGNELITAKADFNYLDLLAYRAVSNFIADKLNVLHQSPQIIILKDKKVIYTATHSAINPDKIVAQL